MSDLTGYQTWTRSTAIYDNPIIYPSLELAGEVGEVCNQVKKIYRDDKGIVSPTRKTDLERELGDVLWYIAEICTVLNLELKEIASINLDKLADRAKRGVIKSKGDNR